MPLRPVRRARRGVIGAPVARTVAVVGTAAVVSHGVTAAKIAARIVVIAGRSTLIRLRTRALRKNSGCVPMIVIAAGPVVASIPPTG